jgi:hypothetical protein
MNYHIALHCCHWLKDVPWLHHIALGILFDRNYKIYIAYVIKQIQHMRSQIEEKVKAVSESIITGLISWRQCSKQNGLVLLTRTGKISVLPDKVSLGQFKKVSI